MSQIDEELGEQHDYQHANTPVAHPTNADRFHFSPRAWSKHVCTKCGDVQSYEGVQNKLAIHEICPGIKPEETVQSSESSS